MSVGDFSGVLGRGTAEKELLENLGDPYQSLSVKIRYAGLKEFQRKAKAVMEVGLFIVLSIREPYTRGRNEQNVHEAGIHEPYKHGDMNTEKGQA